MSAVLALDKVSVMLPHAGGALKLLEELNLTIKAGEMLGLVGESGSGKTIASLAIMQLLPKGVELQGRITLDGRELTGLNEAAMRDVRGRLAGMVFQNPLSALNPSVSVGRQIGEAWQLHNTGSRKAAQARALELMNEVGIRDPAARLAHYPHQFSGGERQRVMIAMALACEPKLLIADEPTTGLDPIIARQIMALIARLRRERQMAVLFVTHDLSVVEEHADSIHVLYAGRSVEWGQAKAFFTRPRHPYSQALLGAVARLGQARLQTIPGTLPPPSARPQGCRFAPRCEFRQPGCETDYPPPVNEGTAAHCCRHPLGQMQAPAQEAQKQPRTQNAVPLLALKDISVRYQNNTAWFGATAQAAPALAHAALTLGRGECLGIVGASGSGKSTLGRAVLQMQHYEGEITLDGESFSRLHGAARRRARRRIQVVFQDPRESLNPRHSVGESLAEPLRLAGQRGDLNARVEALLARVGLGPDIAARLPAAISGGQAQRAAIARALAAEPEIIVLDEPTSSLDVSTQAMLLNLLKDLGRDSGLSYMLISHDMGAVSYMADRILVLKDGHIVETGPTASLLAAPAHDYTRALIAAAPQFQKPSLEEN
jgi:peptide/nickel transport system ATP-binding protein